MAKFPQANLGNEATRWGADVERRILDAERDAARRKEGELNANKQGQSSMGLLSQQVKDLTAQQATLATQNATLAAQVATIASVVSKQVVPAAASTSSSGWSIPSGAQTVASLSFTVPSGYTRALVLGVSALTVTNTSGASAMDYSRIVINGSSGPESSVIVGDFNTAPYANTVMPLSASFAKTISGLVGGGSFSVGASVRSDRSSSSTFFTAATLSGQVIFLQ